MLESRCEEKKIGTYVGSIDDGGENQATPTITHHSRRRPPGLGPTNPAAAFVGAGRKKTPTEVELLTLVMLFLEHRVPAGSLVSEEAWRGKEYVCLLPP